MRSQTACTLRCGFPLAAASQTDMLENNPAPLPAENGGVALAFRAFEIKTVRLRPARR